MSSTPLSPVLGQWSYVLDSATDSINGNLVGGTVFEMYGMAVMETADQLIFAINTNLGIDGASSQFANDRHIGWGDLILNFTGLNLDSAQGSLHAISFATNANSGKPELTGVFRNVGVHSVARENGLELGSLGEYINYVNNNGNHSFGGLPGNTNYFNHSQHLKNAIFDYGNGLGGVTLLNQAGLTAQGLNINSFNSGGGIGTHTFGFSIDKSLLPQGYFTAHLAPECANDIIAFEGVVSTPGLVIEKRTNGVDGDQLDSSVRIAPGDPVHWSYEVTNTGNIGFLFKDISVTDNDPSIIPIFDPTSDVGNDGILSPGETWIYRASRPTAENLFTVIDFETDAAGNPLTAGTVISDAYKGVGLTISVPDTTPFDDGVPMIFDTSNPTGGDFDLGTPHRDFGGPGIGDGGRRGQVGENERPLRNVLIIQEPGATEPNDKGDGGILRFDWDAAIKLHYVEILDTGIGGEIDVYDAAGNKTTYRIDALGENSVQTVLIGQENVVRMEVISRDSKAVAGLAYDRYYKNVGSVKGPGNLIADDPSHYRPFNPAIDIEKKTNGFNGDTPDSAVRVAPGDLIIWTYQVRNTGNIAFNLADIVVTDDQGLLPLFDPTSDVFNDGILSPGETWIYKATGIAEDRTISINFDTDSFGNGLERGTVIDYEYQPLGLTISTPGHEFGAMLFDSNNPTGGDWDLRTPANSAPLGKVLIISQDGNSNDPNDNADGGILRFEWANPVRLHQIGLLDIDENGVVIRTYDAAGVQLGTYGVPNLGDNSLQTISFGDELVTRMDLELVHSGAVTGLRWEVPYRNLGTVSVTGFNGVGDTDPSYYLNSRSSLQVGRGEDFPNQVWGNNSMLNGRVNVNSSTTWMRMQDDFFPPKYLQGLQSGRLMAGSSSSAVPFSQPSMVG